MFRDKTSPLVHDVSVDAILDIAEGYEGSQIEDLAIDTLKSSADKVHHPPHRIGVPRIYGFKAFVNVSRPCFFCKDNATRPSTTKQVTGYSIEICEITKGTLNSMS